MAGFGGVPWGHSFWGGGTTAITSSAIYVFPNTALISDEVTIAGDNSLLDVSRNDDFTSEPVTNALWATYTAGTVFYTENSDTLLNASLGDYVSGSTFELTTASIYYAADVEFEYNITSPFLGDTTSDLITYAGLELGNPGMLIGVYRVLQSGIGHAILVKVIIGSTVYASALSLNSSASGKLRLISYNGMLTAMHDDQIVLQIKDTNLMGETYLVTLKSETTESNKPISVQYQSYKSNFGVMFGDTFLSDKTFNNNNRIIGSVPSSTIVGNVPVHAFNHSGLLGIAVGGFTYPLITYAQLSDANNFHATIQNDPALRD